LVFAKIRGRGGGGELEQITLIEVSTKISKFKKLFVLQARTFRLFWNIKIFCFFFVFQWTKKHSEDAHQTTKLKIKAAYGTDGSRSINNQDNVHGLTRFARTRSVDL